MSQYGRYRSCSDGGASSENRRGLAYCSRSWGRLDSDIGETREYDEAHKWGTSGGLQGIVDGHVLSPTASTLGGWVG